MGGEIPPPNTMKSMKKKMPKMSNMKGMMKEWEGSAMDKKVDMAGAAKMMKKKGKK